MVTSILATQNVHHVLAGMCLRASMRVHTRVRMFVRMRLKITTTTTLCLKCVIALQVHHSTEPNSMSVLLYSLHIKIIFLNLKGHNY